MPFPVDTTGYYNKSVDLMNKYNNLNFVQRALNPVKRIPDPNNKNQYMSHKMSYAESDGQYYAYPEVVDINGTLKYLSGRPAMDYAFKNKQAIPLGNDKNFAEYFTTVGYKYRFPTNEYKSALNDYIINQKTLIPRNKKGGSSKNWIQKAVNPKHKGYCTPMTKSTCTPHRKTLAKRFKAITRARKYEDGGLIEFLNEYI